MMPDGEFQLGHLCCILVIVIPAVVVGIVLMVKFGWLK